MGPWSIYADGQLSETTQFMHILDREGREQLNKGATRVHVCNGQGEIVLDSDNGDFGNELPSPHPNYLIFPEHYDETYGLSSDPRDW